MSETRRSVLLTAPSQDLFFEFPWNNFLHSVVYDLIHQILTGRVDGGYNRELTVALFRDARLMHRIIEGSKRNDAERSVFQKLCITTFTEPLLNSEKPKGVRLGYMGHLTLISEDVIGALEHLPPDLRLQIAQYAPQPEWDEYVTGRYKETKKKDTSLLGGGKPVVAPAMRNGAAQWKVDEADAVATAAARPGGAEKQESTEMKGEFRRTSSRREGSADFGNMPMDDEDDEFNSAPPRVRFRGLMNNYEHDVDAACRSSQTTSSKRCNLPIILAPRTKHPMTKRTAAGLLSRRSSYGHLL